LAGLALAVALDRARRQHGPRRAVALPDAALLLVAIPEVGDVDRGHRDGDQILALLADHLPLLDVLAEVLLDTPPDDLPEPAVVLLDLQRHRRTILVLGIPS